MFQTTHHSTWFDQYWPSFRRDVHQLIAWGYEDAKDKILWDNEEPDITGFIVEAIQDRLRSPSCPSWCDRYSLKENNPVPSKGRKGKHRKMPDIIIESTVSPRPEYIFEAKPLRKKGYRERVYLSKEGLQRFIEGDYASRYLEAAMIGYVRCDTVAVWVGRLKKAIDKDEIALMLRSPQQEVQVIDAFQNEWMSEHERLSGENIRIYHIILNCLF